MYLQKGSGAKGLLALSAVSPVEDITLGSLLANPWAKRPGKVSVNAFAQIFPGPMSAQGLWKEYRSYYNSSYRDPLEWLFRQYEPNATHKQFLEWRSTQRTNPKSSTFLYSLLGLAILTAMSKLKS